MKPAYARINSRRKRLRKKGYREEAAELRKQALRLPSLDPNDPNYRRLRYTRYADDFVLGFCGPESEAEEIKHQLKTFLKDELKLELSESKTLITHARSQKARFLGYDIHVIQNNQLRDKRGIRTTNGGIGLTVPEEVIREKYQTYMQNGKPVHRTMLTHNSVFSTVAQYQQEYRGIVEYYKLAYNLHRFNQLKWIMEVSLTKTLACKLRISVSQVRARFLSTIQTPDGPRKVIKVIIERQGRSPLQTYWGGISLKRQIDAILNDHPRKVWNDSRSELVQRLLAQTCELCGSQVEVEVHHIRGLKDLKQKGRSEPPEWVKVMAARRRKTLVVCKKCHDDIHAGRVDQNIVRR